MGFAVYLQDTVTEIDRLLETRMTQWAEGTQAYSPLLPSLCHVFADGTRDGKRLRATLVRMAYDMMTSTATPAIYDAALAYEVFQTAILAHDDIIDKSPLRRGKLTIFKRLEKRCVDDLSPTCDAAHYGISQTICLGDMGLFLAVQILIDSNFAPDIKNKAVSYFTQSVIDTIAGQLIDVELPYLPDTHTISPDDLFAVSRYKTARYTMTGPLGLGATLAGADAETQKALTLYGDYLGIAFQLKDDMLGVFGDEKTIGKSVTSDITEGKLTLLYYYARQNATPAQQAILSTHYGHAEITPDVHDAIKEIFTDTGAKDAVEAMIDRYVTEAVQYIPFITTDPVYAGYLQELADYMVKRVK